MSARTCVSVVSVPHHKWVYHRARQYTVAARRDGVRTWRAGPFVGPRRRSQRLAWQDARETTLDVLSVRHGQPERLMDTTVWVLLDRLMELAPEVSRVPPCPIAEGASSNAGKRFAFHLHYNANWPHTWVAAFAATQMDDPYVRSLVLGILRQPAEEVGEVADRLAYEMWLSGCIEDYDQLRRQAWPLHRMLVGPTGEPTDIDHTGPVAPGWREDE